MRGVSSVHVLFLVDGKNSICQGIALAVKAWVEAWVAEKGLCTTVRLEQSE